MKRKFKVGDRVHHEEFGDGTVYSVNDDECIGVAVEFDEGNDGLHDGGGSKGVK